MSAGARIAALDLGSNSLKITVAELDASGAPRVLAERSEITRVGQGLDTTGRIAPEAADRTMAGLAILVELARSFGVERIACVGTAGLRGASNAGALLARARAELGLEVEIIDGLREAELSFRGPALSYGPGPVVVADVGGRSTELVSGDAGPSARIATRVSLEIGSVRLTERFLAHDPPEPAELDALDTFLREVLAGAPAPQGGWATETRVIGVSGTVLSLLGLQLDTDEMADVVQHGEGTILLRSSVESAYEELRRRPAAERIRGTVLPEGRADVIVAGAMIVRAILDRYHAAGMIASNRGVRFGLLLELAGELGAQNAR